MIKKELFVWLSEAAALRLIVYGFKFLFKRKILEIEEVTC